MRKLTDGVAAEVTSRSAASFRLVVDVAWARLQSLVDPYRLVGGHQRVPVDAGTADVDDAPDTHLPGLFEQPLGGIHVDGTELPVVDSADMWCVQCSSMDEEVRPPKRGTAHLRVSEIPQDAGPPARCSVDPTNGPATRFKGRCDRRAYAA
jgi:hypothetical protein